MVIIYGIFSIYLRKPGHMEVAFLRICQSAGGRHRSAAHPESSVCGTTHERLGTGRRPEITRVGRPELRVTDWDRDWRRRRRAWLCSRLRFGRLARPTPIQLQGVCNAATLTLAFPALIPHYCQALLLGVLLGV